LGKKGTSGGDIGNGNNNMVDATRNGIESGSTVHLCVFEWSSLIASVSNFDAVRFSEQCAKNLFCKVGIDIFVNSPLPTGGEYLENKL